MSTLSASGARRAQPRAFDESLAELKQWREATTHALAGFRRWALVNRLLDEHSATRLGYLERRLAAERLTVAFVAEFSRGKSELINALFFADLGHRLLPAGAGRTTLCPTEIAWDPARAPGLRLLPIETRESPKALREFMQESDTWTEVPLDPAHPEKVAAACEVISESLEVPAAQAAALGFPIEGDAAVSIPRWRYALLNFPHPLLASGLAILDTPGHNTLGSEPELTLHRVPDAAAIVFMLAADAGVTRSDHELWRDHIAPIEGVQQTCFVVLNKIDGLRDGLKTDHDVLGEIDRQVRSTSETLGVAPTQVFALSARQALVARIQGDRDGLIKSRMYRLEQALAQGMVHARRLEHARAVRSEAHGTLAEARAVVESRLAFARSQLEELGALQDRNQKLVETLARKAALERGRIEQARAVLMGLRTVHNRHADELARLLDPNAVREAAIQARRGVLESAFSSGIGEALDGFFTDARERIRVAVGIIDEARKVMQNVSRRLVQEYRIPAPDVGEFATGGFDAELQRLQARCDRDFKGAASLLLHRRKTLGALFFDTIALKSIRVFEIADRESRTWMNGFIRPLDSQVAAYQEQVNNRIEGMARMQNAETDLVGRIEELKAIEAEERAQRAELAAHEERLEALLKVERERSLA